MRNRRTPQAMLNGAIYVVVVAAFVSRAVGMHVLAPSCGICPQGNESGAAGDFPDAALVVPTYPVGNAALTYAALSVAGTTGQDDEREFLVSLGLVSQKGNQSRPTPYHDKVTLYAGIEGHAGTGDIWAINPLVTQMPFSGDYNAQGIELDFNNANAHRGDADGGEGLAPPVSYGLSISGAAPFRSTSAMLVSGTSRMWNRGIVFANDCIAQSTVQDLGSPLKSIDIRGNPGYGVFQSSSKSKNFFAGGTGIGAEPDAEGGAALRVGGDISVEGRVRLPGGTAVVSLGADHAVHVTGTASLDNAGAVTVTFRLPDALRFALYSVVYQLTAVGAPMPQLHVASEAALCAEDKQAVAFGVAGGQPGKKVSWQVTLTL